MAPVDFLVIGHICKDVSPAGFRLGGTVTYAAITASRLGLRAAILTRAAADLALPAMLAGVDVRVLDSARTTTFENTYADGRRTQRLLAVGDPLGVADVPAVWRATPLVLLGPLAQELEPALIRAFPHAALGVSPQGWMRAWDEEGRVFSRPRLWRAMDMSGARLAVVSEEDIAGDPGVLEHLTAQIPIVALTQGRRGSTIYVEGKPRLTPPRPTREVDPTGAGDVFAAAFLIRLAETDDPMEAGLFANVAASFSVEASGAEGIPTRAQVLAWLAGSRR